MSERRQAGMRWLHEANRRPAAALASAALLATLLAPAPAAGQGEPVPTRLVVRAVAHDAKVIGSGVGGARITIRDAATGEVLARGIQEGGTGDTERIMRRPVARGDGVYAVGDAAAFEATLELAAPRRVEIEAEAPLDAPAASRQVATKTLWVWPGRHLAGQGVVLRLHGFFVEILAPGDGVDVAAGDTLEVAARVRMMCGCPTEPGGLWDSDRYEMTARLLRGGAVVASAPLRFAGQTSRFGTSLAVPGAGEYRLEVLVADTSRANVGRAVVPVGVGGR